ncbi:hypothetical protein Prudu_008549 [Prunus dulcis]|uniref:Integrase catalytic domain-containing protein n=1 Tax=Prunus dulcis TaxID=3755 RepID=A0A4Y1R4S7_PRUDU|nr:hypothetical protein Prudu_008549 [Prunus dulcis]
MSITGSNTWIIDTGASDHMTYDAKFFDELSSNTRDPYITSANGLPSPITGSQDHETIGHGKRIGVSKTNKNLVMACRLGHRHLATLSVCFHLYSALVMSPVLSVRHVKVFRTDNGGEYVNNTLASFFRAQGIIHQTTTSFTPQQNGVSERKNRQLLEVARSLMLDMGRGGVNWRVLDWRMMCLKILLSGRKRHVALKQVTGHPYLKMKLVVPVKKPLIAFGTRSVAISKDEAGDLGVETTSHTETSDQLPVFENNDSDSLWMSSMQYSNLPCQCPNLLMIVNQDALSNPKWMDAMNFEMDALNKNKTWDLVPLPRGKKTVGCRWVFTLKHKDDSSIDRYKDRLVANGYTQTYRVDYLETFALVAKLNTVRVVLYLAANRDWPLLQFDVKNAFLYGDLNEEIYMDLPPGIPVTSKDGVVCKLRKSLYGLKQSPRAWFGRFAASMKKFGYVQNNSDHTLFLKRHKEVLASEFEIKSLGDLKYFLGIEVAISKHGIFLSQRKYILDLLAETGRLYCKPIDTSITPGKGLMFYKYGHTDVEGYTDADWAGSVTVDVLRLGISHLLVVILLLGGVKSRKWCLGLVPRPRIVGWLKKPMDLYCDNKAGIVIAHNHVQHDRTKHVEVDRHFVKEKLDAEIISFPFISSEYQLADVLTKVVSTTILCN